MKMNKTVILFIILFIASTLFSNGQQYKAIVSAGIPIVNSSIYKYSINLSVKRKTITNFYIGIGCNYSNIDVPASSFEYLIFDRKYFNSFVAFQFFFNLTYKLKASPALNTGYAFVSYNLSGYDTQKLYTQGVSLNPVFTVIYILNKNINIGLYYSYIKIYSKFERPDIVAPNPFINSKISNHGLGISCILNFLKN